ncbi:unnamed protein product, partial [Brenthis ino]
MWLSVTLALAVLGVALGDAEPARVSFDPVKAAETERLSEAAREQRSPNQSLLQLLSAIGVGSQDEPVPRTSGRAVGGWPIPAYPYEMVLDSLRPRNTIIPIIVLPVSLSPSRPTPRPECDTGSTANKFNPNKDEDYEDNYYNVPHERPREPSTRRPPSTGRRPKPRPEDRFSDTNDDEPPRRPHKKEQPSFPSYVQVEKLDETPTSPPIDKTISSKELVEKFRAQVAQEPRLPPVLLSSYDSSERLPIPEDVDSSYVEGPNQIPDISPSQQPTSAQSTNSFPSRAYGGFIGANVRNRDPPRPRFDRPLLLHGELTVPRADFTEAYTVWWDAKTGSSKIDFHGGSTSTYRTVMPDGGVQRLEMRIDRSGDRGIRRCAKATSRTSQPADLAQPALPDMELFSFAGYEQGEGGRLERWRHSVTGRAGELGGARGEALTLRHELLLQRLPDDSARPLQYIVNVDSSVLGANCDGYEHRYIDVREHTKDLDFFTPKIDEICDSVEILNASKPDDLARLEPLREFTLPLRDLRYNEVLQRFKQEFNRQYIDNIEEAVRKNLLIQHSRFISSGNREGATFELGVNFLGDRLNDELENLLGVNLSAENIRAEHFPHNRSSVQSEEARLPNRFDWRPRGGVSPVRYQGSCSSCWAFAVAGAVEGALFIRTRRLVPLSEKCLVDCAHPFGGNGCKGTWPSHAYDYVQNRGLPALEEYPPYEPKVDKCAEDKVPAITRISAHVNVTINSVPALKVAIRRHAPSVVLVDGKAKSFVFYKKGVLYDDRCAKNKLNHAVLAVGWGERKGEPHFILKNSWSEAWGERGYVRVQARANTCGVLSRPSYPRLEDGDVQRAPAREPAHERARVRPRDIDYDESQ